MGTLQHINAGEPHLLTCHCCTSVLGDERAVANTPSGPRYFCKADPASRVATSNIAGGSIEAALSSPSQTDTLLPSIHLGRWNFFSSRNVEFLIYDMMVLFGRAKMINRVGAAIL